jgi:hypothetical protein
MTTKYKYVFKFFNYLLFENKKKQHNYLQHTNQTMLAVMDTHFIIHNDTPFQTSRLNTTNEF